MSITVAARQLAFAVLCAVPALSVASVFTPGEFRVNEMGAATYSVPIQVPPGLNGVEPKLSLSYNSQSGNGLVGQGWAMSGLSTITRCSKTRAQDGAPGSVQYNWEDRYCLDGQKLMQVASSAGYGGVGTQYRTELESFSRIVANGTQGKGPAGFTVSGKDGRIMEYGLVDASTDAQIRAEGKETVAIWALKRVRDRKGNEMVVTYESAKAGEYHAVKMEYAYNLGAANNNAKASVVFSYEDRPDPKTSYRGGSASYLQKRLTKISTYSTGNLVRTYSLTYDPNAAFWSDVLPLSRLTQIKECGANGQCQVPVNLVWNSSGWGHVDLGKAYPNYTGTWSSQPAFHDKDGKGKQVMSEIRAELGLLGVGDFLGNGKQELMYKFGDNIIGFVSDSSFYNVNNYANYALTVNGWANSSFYITDLNGDGLNDILQNLNANSSVGHGDGYVISYINMGGHNFSAYGFNSGLRCSGADFGDVDGDGIADLVVAGDPLWNWVASYIEVRFYKGLSTGGFSSSPISSFQIPQGYYDLDSEDLGCYLSGVGFTLSEEDNTVIGMMVYSPDSSARSYINRGEWKFEQGGAPAGKSHNDGIDFNGDGHPDYLVCDYADDNSTCLRSNIQVSNGLDMGGNAYIPNINRLISNEGYSKMEDLPRWDVVYGDATGTGEITYVLAEGFGGRFTHNQPLITTIKAGDQSIVSLSYAPLTQYANAFQGPYNGYDFVGTLSETTPTTPSYPNAFLPYTHLRVVDQITHLGHGTFKYDYQGLLSNHKGRGILGFATITATNVKTGVNTKTFYNQEWPFTGTVRETVQKDGSGLLLTDIYNGYHALSMADSGVKSTYAALYATIDRRYEPAQGSLAPFNVVTTKRVSDCHYYAKYVIDADAEMQALTPTTAPENNQCYGNVLAERVSASDGYSKLTKTTFRNNNAQWVVGLPVQMVVTDTAPDIGLGLGGVVATGNASPSVSNGASAALSGAGAVRSDVGANRNVVPTYSATVPSTTLKPGVTVPTKPD